MAFVLDEKLTTKWFDTLTVIPDDGDNVWFIVGDKIYVGKYIAEARVFTKADKSMVDLSCVRQWSPMNGEKQICKQPEEDQVIAAKIPNLPCYVTGIYSSNLSQKNLGVDGPGLLLDQDYNISELGIKSPVSWEEVFDWYELPLEPLLLLPVIQVGLVPITYGELMSNQICLDCQCEEPKSQEAQQTEPKPTSAIVASKNRNLMENNNEVKPMNNKLTETRVSYELTQYGSYQPWGQAKEAWQYILDNGKFDALDSYLEEMYPEGIGETELNDILAYEPETVYEAIGLDDPYAEEDEEEEEEEEEEDEPIAEEEYNGYDIYTWDSENYGGDYVTICKNDHYVASANSVEDAKKKIDAGNLKESKRPSKHHKLQESDDGWSDEVINLFEDVLKDSDRFAYEIRSGRRGVYTGADTVGVLAQAAYKIAEEWQLAASDCEDMAEDLDESKKSKRKKLKEDYGWECDPDDAWNLFDEMKEAFGAEYLLDSIVRAMGTYDLAETLAFICRNEDFRSQYLGNLEEDEDEEEIDESKKVSGKLSESIHKINHGNGIIGYAEPGEWQYLFLGGTACGHIADGEVYLCKGCPQIVYDTFKDYKLTPYTFGENAIEEDEEEIEESNNRVKDSQDFSHLPESLSKQVSDFFNLIKF